MTIEPGEGTPMTSPPPSAAPPPPPASAPPAGTPAGSAGAGSPGTDSTSGLLQSMLSRAVEDQAGEQRELTNAVTDMRNQLLRLSQELAELRLRPTDDGADAHINTVTVELREAVRFLSERLDGVTRMVAGRGEELADIRTALTAIDAHVRSQAETIGVLSAGLQALPSYGERVSVLQDNLQVLHRQLVGIEEAIARSGSDEKVMERLGALEAALTPMTHRLNEISDLGTAQSALLAQLQGSSSQLQQAVAGVHESVAGVHESLSGVHESVAGVQSGVTGVHESVAGVHESVAGVQESVAGVQSGVAGMHERIEPLASELTSISGDLAAGHTAAPADEVDARIADSVAAAIQSTERRLMAHVDEAVVALAQTLLRRRGAPAGSPGTPPTSPSAEAASGYAPATAEPAAPTTGGATPPFFADEADQADDLDEAEAGDELDEDDALDAGDDEIDEAWEADEDDAEDEDEDEHGDEPGPRVGVLDDDAEPGDDAEPDAEPGPAWSAPAAPSDDAELPTYAQLPPPVAESMVPAPATESWTPQTPPERNPADPTVNLEQGSKKRRWGRKK